MNFEGQAATGYFDQGAGGQKEKYVKRHRCLKDPDVFEKFCKCIVRTGEQVGFGTGSWAQIMKELASCPQILFYF